MEMVLECKPKKVLIPAWPSWIVLAIWLEQGLYGEVYIYVKN